MVWLPKIRDEFSDHVHFANAFFRRMWYSGAMKRLLIAVLLFLSLAAPVLADDPPPQPTLAPVMGATTSATQTLQLQEFARESAYLVGQTTIYTATVNGATWAIERRFTYGEAGITIVLMAIALMLLFNLIYKLAVGGT